MKTASIESARIKKIIAGVVTDEDDHLAIEEPLQVQLEYSTATGLSRRNIAVTMRTPGCDKELAAGFLFTEGIINHKNQVEFIKESNVHEGHVKVILKENVKPNLLQAERNFYTTSSCGVCGKASIDAISAVSQYKNVKDFFTIRESILYELPSLLREQQKMFESTGGLHACALFDTDGNFIKLREDIGRHNALDKLIGAEFLGDRLPLTNSILLLSGRASFELIQKAAMAGIKIVAAIGAPSSLAVELAKENDITLIGFLKNERFNIYSGEQRILTGRVEPQ
jgi:FdhD protein